MSEEPCGNKHGRFFKARENVPADEWVDCPRRNNYVGFRDNRYWNA